MNAFVCWALFSSYLSITPFRQDDLPLHYITCSLYMGHGAYLFVGAVPKVQKEGFLKKNTAAGRGETFYIRRMGHVTTSLAHFWDSLTEKRRPGRRMMIA